MNREKELEDYLKDYRKKRREKKQKELPAYVRKLAESFFEKLGIVAEEQKYRQREENVEPVKFVFLCRLLSSYYTQSYDAVMGLSDSRLYLDEGRSEIFWKPVPVYEGIEEDMEEAKRLLSRKFIRLEASELFYIRKKLLGDDWELLQGCFRVLSRQAFQQMEDRCLKMDEEILFVCGDYMDRLKIVWDKEQDIF